MPAGAQRSAHIILRSVSAWYIGRVSSTPHTYKKLILWRAGLQMSHRLNAWSVA